MAISRVDLPLPDGPARLSDLPRPTDRLTPLRTWTSPAPVPRRICRSSQYDGWIGHASGPYIDVCAPRRRMKRRYGGKDVSIQPFRLLLAGFAALAGLLAVPAEAAPIRIVALGDSLTAGYGLGAGRFLHGPVASGAEGARPRCRRSSMPASPAIRQATGWPGSTGRSDRTRKAVIVELGANDALRGIAPK